MVSVNVIPTSGLPYPKYSDPVDHNSLDGLLPSSYNYLYTVNATAQG